MSRMIILAGAPEPAHLDWNEKSLITPSDPDPDPSRSNSSLDTQFKAKWRQISSDSLQMRPSLPRLAITPLTQVNPDPADFFSPADHVAAESPTAASDVSGDESQPSGIGSADSTNDALAEYYDKSFSVYEAVPDTQTSDSSYQPGTPIYETTSLDLFPDPANSNDSATGRSIIRTPSQRRLSQAPKPRQLTNLIDIPNASVLLNLAPQTKTINLIVAVLSISPTRKVTTGKSYGKPRQVEIVELLVADETKSNFAITMWLPRELHVNWRDRQNSEPNTASPSHSPADGARSALRRNLKSLRSRDIVMLQNVALTTYKGKVAGASLKGEVTKLELLHRRKVDEADEEGWYSNSALRRPIDAQIRKVKGVRDWLVDFVGEDKGEKTQKGRKGRGGSAAGLLMPEDTQY